ncbi:MAG: right-handed parallel beta-helix repeat-containing protein [Candidatus Hydrogenedentes bacterium]|nr:right-handed parallel beta-helix repeat-containing protein [Candidatus Hydrogenedentota bacterium]
MRFLLAFAGFALLVAGMGNVAHSAEHPAPAQIEYHVSVRGNDANDGSSERPLRTISAAAQLAQPGDVVTVHEGVYRESISPPRGGESDAKRIVYQAAAGETVEIKGSEIVTGWEKAGGDTWTVTVPNSLFGGYNPYQDLIHGDWFNPLGRQHHTGAVYLNGDWLMEAASLYDVLKPTGTMPRWFAEVGDTETVIWAQFKGVDPNKELVEINVRRTVFYPEEPGMNFITVRGFIMRQAATQWAPPTAEQVGLIGTHWSKGWIIENNVISHSKCTGSALGKYGDQWDNTSEDTAEGYVLTIQRATENGWSRENIGGHIVRNNMISHCEQAGVVGSLGAVFSAITGNTIHDIHVQRLFTGAEMAGIKIHAAIDTEISRNHIYRTVRGIWLDWMNQGARVTGNLLHENASEDLFVEVNHGPFLVDNNLFLSERSLLDMSEGGAYVHNLMTGKVAPRPELSRETPFHKAHSTEVAGLRSIEGGDDRFFNNIFVNTSGLAEYDGAALPVQMAGNVFLNGAMPSKHEQDALVLQDFDPAIRLAADADGVTLHIAMDSAWGAGKKSKLVTSELLGRAKIPDLLYVNPDDTPLRIDTDYFGESRSESSPFPGPFELPNGGEQTLKVWPVGEASRAETAP